MKTRTTLAALAATLLATAAAQAADHRESPALAIATQTSSTSSGQTNGSSTSGGFQTEIISMDLTGR